MSDSMPLSEGTVSHVKRRWHAALILGALFCTSAAATVFYLSSTTAPIESQTAAVAAVIPAVTLTPLDLQADAAYVVDATNGQVLYQKNADAQLPLASLTKVALALVVAESLPSNTVVTITTDTAPDEVDERLPIGSRWALQDIIDYTLIISSNEGAQLLANAANAAVIAQYPDAPKQGNDTAVLWRMNQLSKELSLPQTYFLDVTGLDRSTTEAGAYGSARDVARLFAFAQAHDRTLFTATTKDAITFTSIDGQIVPAVNTDKALGAIPGIIMGKTGLTDLAGGNLAVVYNIAPSHPVVAVVLHSSDDGRFDDMRKIVAATASAFAAQ